MADKAHRRFLDLALRDLLASREPQERGLSERERASLETHLAACPACRRRIAAMDTRLKLLESRPEREPAAGFTDSVMARLGIAEPAGSGREMPVVPGHPATGRFTWISRVGSLRLAAGFLPLLLVSALLFHGALQPTGDMPQRATAAHDTFLYATAVDGEKTIGTEGDARSEAVRRKAAQHLGLAPDQVSASVTLRTNYRQARDRMAAPPRPRSGGAPAAERPRALLPDGDTRAPLHREREEHPSLPADAMENPPQPAIAPDQAPTEAPAPSRTATNDRSRAMVKEPAGALQAAGGVASGDGADPAAKKEAPEPERAKAEEKSTTVVAPADRRHPGATSIETEPPTRRIAMPQARITLRIPPAEAGRLDTRELSRALARFFPDRTRFSFRIETVMPENDGPDREEAPASTPIPVAWIGWLLLELLFRAFFLVDGRSRHVAWRLLVPALVLGSLFLIPWLILRGRRSG